jgi:hypothetical protein
MRGTPKNRPKSHQQIQFAESPTPSSIPRPALEHHISQSDAGTSTLSASRAKQTKRDEVRAVDTWIGVGRLLTMVGDPPQDRRRPEQEEEPRRSRPHVEESTSGYCSRPQAEPGSANQAQHNRRRSRPADGSQEGGLRPGHR